MKATTSVASHQHFISLGNSSSRAHWNSIAYDSGWIEDKVAYNTRAPGHHCSQGSKQPVVFVSPARCGKDAVFNCVSTASCRSVFLCESGMLRKAKRLVCVLWHHWLLRTADCLQMMTVIGRRRSYLRVALRHWSSIRKLTPPCGHEIGKALNVPHPRCLLFFLCPHPAIALNTHYHSWLLKWILGLVFMDVCLNQD